MYLSIIPPEPEPHRQYIKAYMINPEQRTITPFEPSSDVCQRLVASIDELRPPYLGHVGSSNGVFLSDGAYCVEDPYGAWEPPQKPWFEMDFSGPDGGVAENRRLVGPCLVLGYDGHYRHHVPCDATITVEDLAKCVRFQPTTPSSSSL
jgi:hypothetical protein